MLWLNRYALVAFLVVILLTNLLVVVSVSLSDTAVPQNTGLMASMVMSTGLTAVVAWSLFLHAHSNARRVEDLRRLVFRDRLTNVATRDFLFDRLAQAPEATGVVLMLDIDHFKGVNDRYGHLAGDAVIRTVASQLRLRCRQQDIVCRFGGEEFLVFLEGSDMSRGEMVAERLRSAVAAEVTRFDGRDLRVTVSVGVARKTAATPLDRAIRAADEALYRAKRRGRNRVVLWRDGTKTHRSRSPEPACHLPRHSV